MRRRRLLVTALALVAVLGLTGCSGLLGEETPGGVSGPNCTAPSEPIEDAFPTLSNFERVRGPENISARSDAVERNVLAGYRNDNGTRLTMTIARFNTSEWAEERARAVREASNASERALGFLVVEEYVLIASGPNEGTVDSFVSAVPSLSEHCVVETMQYA
jgi:hypothetical protein